MKIKETRHLPGAGFGGPSRTETRVRELAEGETKPPDAEEVPDNTPVADWQELEVNG